YALFGTGGGATLSEDLGVPLVGQIPLEPAVSSANDAGTPLSVAAPDSDAGAAFAEIARRIAENLLPPVDMGGCTARVLAAVEGALGTPA
ncbi:MAG: Mrp/NBP35 family ATP-binding protein, partial [Actinomycetota bacterium]|nr:Mrp/NBP35 family ATP-binding protein [Actinomycetota bacterium]